MPLPHICRTLRTFKHFYLSEYEERVVNNNLHRRRAITLAREEDEDHGKNEYYIQNMLR